jgi:DNA-binding IclR family transcriptional regulator
MRYRNSITVAEASQLLGVARSTAHRLLAMLQHRGLVLRDRESKTYVQGPALLELGLAAVRHIDLATRVQPLLQSLVQQTGETAHAAIRRDTNVIFVACVESPHAVRAGVRTGTVLPAHCTASGKALLAQLPDAVVASLYRGRLPRLTPRSIGSTRGLLEELAQVRQAGFALNRGESELELNTVAVALPEAPPAPPAAVVVAGPSFRLGTRRLREVSRVLLEGVRALSPSFQHVESRSAS